MQRPLNPAQTRIFLNVLNHILPEATQSSGLVAHMVVLLLPKLGLYDYVCGQRPNRLQRFKEYPVPQLEDLLRKASALGGPDGLCRREFAVYDRAMNVDAESEPAAAATAAGTPAPRDVARARSRIHDGQLSKAARALLEPGQPPLPASRQVIEKLQALHPAGGPAFRERAPPRPSPIALPELVRESIHKTNPSTSPGASGWTVGLTRTALRSDAMARFLCSTLIDGMYRGLAPAHHLYTGSRLTALPKPASSGIRPIATGEVFYRLAMRVVLTHLGPQCSIGLLPTQFGVGTPGGTEPIIRAVEHVHTGTLPHTYVTTLDFSNAYNSVHRSAISAAVFHRYYRLYNLVRWAYGEPSPLLFTGLAPADPHDPAGEDQHRERLTIQLASAEGVRQGDPLAPLLFSVAIRPFLEQLGDALGDALGDDHLVLAYLDDVIVFSTQPTDVIGVAARVAERLDIGLRLNVNKSRTYSRDEIATGGIPVLGTVVGGLPGRTEFALSVATALEDAIERLCRAELGVQDAWLLLAQCIQLRTRHLQRQLHGDDIPWLWERLDSAIQAGFMHLRGDPRQPIDELSRHIATLPTRMGGLGLLSHAECRQAARTAMIDHADKLLRGKGHPARRGHCGDSYHPFSPAVDPAHEAGRTHPDPLR